MYVVFFITVFILFVLLCMCGVYLFSHCLLTEPGVLEFAHPSFVFKESVGKALVAVNRLNGADGRIQVDWKTENMTAVNGKDFEGGEGILVFEHGEIAKAIEIPIYDDQVSGRCISFVYLFMFSY